MVIKSLKKPNKYMARFFVGCFVLVILFMNLSVFAVAKDDDTIDVSFYKASSAAAGYYDLSNNPLYKDLDGKPGHNLEHLTIGNASVLVSYLDSDLTKIPLVGGIISFLSSAVQSRGYASGTGSAESVRAYTLYGRALNDLGLDSTGRPSSISLLRGLSGGLMILAYSLVLAVDFLFTGVLKLLVLLNPFQLFLGENGITGVMANYLPGGVNDGSPMSGLAKFVSDVYGTMSSLAWVVIPFFFFVMVSSILFLKSSGKQGRESPLGKFRKYFTRVAFLVLGIPLLGMMYTSSLNTLVNTMDSAGSGVDANYVVSSTFVDFESWAATSYLALPEDITITLNTDNSPSGSVDFMNTTDVRTIASTINLYSKGLALKNPNDNVTGTKDWNDRAMISVQPSLKGISTTIDLLTRYMTNAFYQSSDFESEVKGTIGLTTPELYTHLETASDIDFWLNSEYCPLFLTGASPVTNAESTMLRCSHGSGDLPNIWIYSGHGAPHNAKRDHVLSGNYGLSTLGMYNYLNTSFEKSSIEVYSPNKATSGLVKKSHKSVNLVGSGFTGFLYYVQSFVMLAVMTILGIGYALGMFIAVIRRTIRMILAVPMAVLGSLKSMSRVVTIVFMMIIEIIGTIFTYTLVVEFLGLINGIGSDTFGSIIQTGLVAVTPDLPEFGVNLTPYVVFPGAFSANFALNSTLIAMKLIVSIIITILFGKMAFKLRKSIIKTMDEWMAGWVDVIFATGASGGGLGGAAQQTVAGDQSRARGPGVIKTVTGAAAAGAGMAVSNRLVGATKDGGKGGGSFKGSIQGDAATGGTVSGAKTSGAEGFDKQTVNGEGASGITKDAHVTGDAVSNKPFLAGQSGGLGVISGLVPSSNNGAVKDVGQAKVDRGLASLTTGGAQSAIQDQVQEDIRDKNRKTALKSMVTPNKEVIKGAAEIGIGVATKDVSSVASGSAKVIKGAEETKQAGKSLVNGSDPKAPPSPNSKSAKLAATADTVANVSSLKSGGITSSSSVTKSFPKNGDVKPVVSTGKIQANNNGKLSGQQSSSMGVKPSVPSQQSRNVRPPVQQQQPRNVRPPVQQQQPRNVRPPVQQQQPRDVRPPVQDRHRDVRPPVQQQQPRDVRPPSVSQANGFVSSHNEGEGFSLDDVVDWGSD